MKIAYLIIAHDNPLHLHRLLKALSSESSKSFVHIDKKSNMGDFHFDAIDNVIMSKKRIPVYWGEFSFTKTIYSLIQQALEHQTCFDRIVLLSGADYPLHSVAFIENYFELNRNTESIDANKLPHPGWTGGGFPRLTKYKLNSTKICFINIGQRAFKKIGIIPKERDYKKNLGELIPYGGSHLWALTRDACDYIINFFHNEKSIINFFKNVFFVDEILFHTILANSSFKQSIQPSLTYCDWSAGGAHPAMITEKHLELFRSHNFQETTDYLFARKFSDKTTTVVDALDKLIDEQESKICN